MALPFLTGNGSAIFFPKSCSGNNINPRLSTPLPAIFKHVSNCLPGLVSKNRLFQQDCILHYLNFKLSERISEFMLMFFA